MKPSAAWPSAPTSWLVAATDNNRQGDVYADRVRAIAAEASARYARSRPRADDWNEDLKTLRQEAGEELVAENRVNIGPLPHARSARQG